MMTYAKTDQPPAWNIENVLATLGPEGIKTDNALSIDPETLQELKNMLILLIIGIVLSIALYWGLRTAAVQQKP